jgi:glutamate-ammonia-ligase adenylyltransferase
MSFDALENYYQSQGRSWERYAMIKARVIAGDRSAGVELIELLRPFVYRRYLDFGAFESLREMKSMIERELARKGMEENIKLGPGGIREVEFIAQALQLIFGGRQSELRERRLLAVLDRLAASDHLPRFAVERLASAYRFLRALENRLQQFRDEQTQSLPTDSDGQARIAYALGFSDWHAFGKELGRQRRHVAEQFAQTFAAPQAEEGGDAAASPALLGLWRGELEESDALRVLGEHGFIRADEALRRLQLLRKGRARRATGDQGRRWLDRLIPLLIGATGAGGEPDEPFTRILDLIEVIAGRTAYLALLVENPMALSQLVTLFAGSPWIADYLLRHPALIDELLDPRTLYRPLTREELSADLQRRLDGVAGNDQEGQMEALRHFKHPNVLRVAAADIAGAFKLMKVSDYLTWIAELTVEAAFCASRQQIESRHGRARCQVDGVERQATMLVIGYGKLGGIELGYGSDLDLVFIHDSEGSGQQTDGERPVDNATCFARIGQRLIHMLDTLTPSGILYEVDMRLRPHGNSGPLVASFDAYADYLRREAWTWEHQALVRARAITAAQASELAGRFDQLRGEILCRERDLSTLRSEVVEMRRKMRESLDRSQDGIFDLKQGVSGIVDIEFIVQFLVLAHAARHPELARWSDDIHLLEELGRAGLLAIGEVESLADAFRAYRARLHRCKLQEGSGLVDESLFAAERAAVASVWQRLMIIG